jgi:hypothetical protein
MAVNACDTGRIGLSYPQALKFNPIGFLPICRLSQCISYLCLSHYGLRLNSVTLCLILLYICHVVDSCGLVLCPSHIISLAELATVRRAHHSFRQSGLGDAGE